MTRPSTDVVYAGASLRERQDYALALSKAGELIPRGLRDPNGQPNPGKILLVTEYGNALGIHPIVAINGIDIIEGNLTITPALMSGLVRQNGHKLRISTDGTGANLTATAVLVRADDPQHPFKVTWTMADAKAAGLDGKSNWKKYARAMLKARAISEVCREGAEDVLMGAYLPEEMGATVNEAGEVIEDAEIVEDTPAKSNTTPTRDKVEKRARQRDAGATASKTQSTGSPGRDLGRSRPQEAAAGPALPDNGPTRTKNAVWEEWAGRIELVTGLTALFKLHEDAASVNVLDTIGGNHAQTIEDVFLAKRNEMQRLTSSSRVQDIPEDLEPVY